MGNLREFLESSSINGLNFIASTRKCARLFWICVVSSGFIISGYLIHQSFTNWSNNPIRTTVETKPINEIQFPTVSVCPAENTFTNLNYDLMMLENTALDNDTRQELIQYAFKNFQLFLYKEMKANLSNFDELYRPYHWYWGYTKAQLPKHDSRKVEIDTSTSSGFAKTKFFGEPFDVEKIERNIEYRLFIRVNETAVFNDDYTLMLNISKVSLRTLKPSRDIIKISQLKETFQFGSDDHFVLNMTWFPRDVYIELDRKMTTEDILQSKATESRMPGFQVQWSLVNTKYPWLRPSYGDKEHADNNYDANELFRR